MQSAQPLPPFRIASYHELDSTNLEALRRADAGEQGGLVVIADRQTAGRGRHGRQWLSVDGNLLMSVLLRPGIAPSAISLLSYSVALAVADALDPLLAPLSVRLKWPNDVLLDNAKLAGILIESDIRGDRVEALVIGVGLNIAAAPKSLEYKATCLADHDCGAGRDQIAALFLDALRNRLQQWSSGLAEDIKRDWLSRAWQLGRTISVDTGFDSVRGKFTGIDETGALLLATDSGSRRIVAGSVSYEQAA